MEIRNDFKPIEMQLNRLVTLASAFGENNRTHWHHLKNREDFSLIYDLPVEDRRPLEQIYMTGRDLAVAMSSRLVAFNYPEDFPTLVKFLDWLKGGWVDQVDILKNESQCAKDKCSTLASVPWAINEMIKLYDNQVDMLISAKVTLDGLRQSDLYKWEIGAAQASYPVPEYSKILETIHSIGMMFERQPNTYSNKDEESLRDHILVTLQAVVIGTATGETFNKRGKTDILVRNGDYNEFIGECKFWSGKSNYLNTIDQLLSYLSWRDTNTAIIMFVQNKDFSAVLDKVDSYTSTHPLFLKKIGQANDTWRNFEFRMQDDQSKIVNVAVMLYHIP